jgi:membrane protein required for colicin V production
MTIFDLILLLILGGFVMYGLWFGFIHALGSLFGVAVGAFLAARWYEPVSNWLGFLFGGHQNFAKVICFLIIFTVINRLVGFVFWFIGKIFSIISIIPFLKTIDRLGGAILGFIEGVLVLGLTLFVAARYPLGDWFSENLTKSTVAHYFVSVAKILEPLLPEILNK